MKVERHAKRACSILQTEGVVRSQASAKSPLKKFDLKKAFRIIRKILLSLLLAVILLLLLAGGLVHVPFVQKFLADKASVYLSEYMECEVSVTNAEIDFLDLTATLRGIQILDKRKNPTVYIEYAQAILQSFNSKKIALASAHLRNPQIIIRRYEGDTQSDFKRVISKIAARPKKDTALRKAFIMDRIRIDNGTFYYDAEDFAGKPVGQTDFKHIALSGVNMTGRNFYTRCGRVMAQIDHLEAWEKSEVLITDFASRIYVDKGRLHFMGTRIQTPESNLRLDLNLRAEDWKCFADFIHKVNINGTIQSPSRLAIADLAHFVPSVKGLSATARLSGKVRGPVDNLQLTHWKMAAGDSIQLEGDFSLKGLPDMQNGRIDVKIKKLHLNRPDLDSIGIFQAFGIRLPKPLQELNSASLQGSFSGQGNLDRFIADLYLDTDLGKLHFQNTATDTSNGEVFMNGQLQAENIDMGRLLHKRDLFGHMDLQTSFSMMGRKLKDMTYNVDGIISNMEIDKDMVAPLNFDLVFARNFFAGEMACHDPELDFRLDGIMDFRSDTSRTRYLLDLRNIDLSPLHLMDDTGFFAIQTRLDVNHIGNKVFDIYGNIRLDDTRITRLGKQFHLDSLRLDIRQADSGIKEISVRSDLLFMDAQGRWDWKNISEETQRYITYYFPHAFDSLPPRDSLQYPPMFQLDMHLSNPDSLLDVFFPAWRMPLGMDMDLSYNARTKHSGLNLNLPYIQNGSIALMRNKLELQSDTNHINLDIKTKDLYLDDSLRFKDFLVSLQKKELDILSYTIEWEKDSAKISQQTASLQGIVQFLSQRMIRINLQDFALQTGNTLWRNYPAGNILISRDSLIFDSVGMYSPQSLDGILIKGNLSHNPASSLRVDFSNFNFSYLVVLLRKFKMDIDAQINGYAEIKDFYGLFHLNSKLKMDHLHINQTSYGWGELSLDFNRENAVKAEFRILEREANSPDARTSLIMNGTYRPRKGKRLAVDGRISNLPVSFLNGFFASFAEDMDGKLNGAFRIGGTLSKPVFDARFFTDTLAFTVSALESHYVFNDLDFSLDSKGIDFKSGRFKDPLFNTEGNLQGSIDYDNFKNIRLNLGLNFNNLLAMNTTRKPGSLFWGTVFGSGTLNITGPVSDLNMLLNAQVEDNSDISFDFSSSAGGNGSNFITFVEKSQEEEGITSLESLYARNRVRFERKGRLTLDLNLNVTPGLTVNVGLHNTSMTGNLMATGNGLLRLYMPGRNPQLFGTYTIDGGEFDFSMVNLINRKFILEEGGTISWIGPMADARVNIRADYQTKASLYPVLASLGVSEEDAQQLKQNATVKSIIVLSGNLTNPDIGFDIDLANTDEDTKDRFFSVIKKDDEDEMLRQTFSLLMFNNFMAVEGSSANSAGSAALSSSSEFIFSQFNNFLSQFGSDFNVGVNYKPGDVNTNSEWQVSMSGQLFDDRLVINGNLGVSDRGSNAGANTVVGDVDVEWKFTEELRLRGFNHSNDQDLTKPANSYTQGVGIVFRRNFDNLHEFLHGTKPRRTKAERQNERRKNKEIRQLKREQKQQ